MNRRLFPVSLTAAGLAKPVIVWAQQFISRTYLNADLNLAGKFYCQIFACWSRELLHIGNRAPSLLQSAQVITDPFVCKTTCTRGMTALNGAPPAGAL